ncbi:flagellar basal body P-ring formation protein FlgA [Pseudomonas psychrophila]|uniref:Flagella basal body P-ring formation protein FlgA n=1 Tax=Pseudomonas psychrophila TaxID=122355 RepID=A0A8I1FWA9_9PSED|nr:flagellar basal body P-ring formation protein FlgA [Pseudomonas psychrophila]
MNTRRVLAAALLPLQASKGAPGGRRISSCAPIGALLLLACSAAVADEALDRQIDQAVGQYFTLHLIDKTADQGWQASRLTHKVFALPEGAPTAPCEQPLQIDSSGHDWRGYGRVRLTLTCAAPQWSVDVTSQATVFIRAVAAAQIIERGQLITQAMLGYQEVPVTRQSTGLFNKVDEVVGLSAKRRTRSQQVLTRDMLVAPWLVRRGERVTVLANHGDIHASTQGEAQQDGRLGMVIRVKNTASGKIIEAKVIGSGKVSSTFEPPGK